MCLFTGCSRRALHEAQAVVAQADSLWHNGKMYGIDEGDSATLAQAYGTLEKQSAVSRQLTEVFPFVHSTSSLCTSYVHACYHYGRLLREKDDPVAAMQCFINATHARSRDYHILGRVYSNMGDICHLAEEFPLSYDMFERSANMFFENGDTLAYFYALNDMAFEKAMLADKEITSTLLTKIENQCADLQILSKTTETRAELYLRLQQYDSAIYYASELCRNYTYYSLGPLIKAQAYSYFGKKDSAAKYASQVLSESNDLSDRQNALYILTNDDESKDNAAIRQAAADRSDAQKLLEIRRSKLSQAVQLLEQDLNKKPDLRWLYAIIVTLVVMGAFIGFYVYRKRKKQSLLAQKIDALEQATSTMQEKHDELEHRVLTTHKQKEEEINHKCELLRNKESRESELAWADFGKMCSTVDKHFYMLTTKLRCKQILNETEIRLCVLVLLNLSRAEIADTLPYAPNSVGKLKDHTAKKLGTTGKNLRYYLLKTIIEG